MPRTKAVPAVNIKFYKMGKDCSETRKDLDNVIEKLSPLVGENIKQKINEWRSLIYLTISPGTIINILHPVVILLSTSLLPHSYSFWIQVPLYLFFLFALSKWCRYVAMLKERMKKQQSSTVDIVLPTLEMCKEKDKETEEDKINFFHIRNAGILPKGQEKKKVKTSKEDDKISKKSHDCKPFITLADLSEEEVKQNEPVWLNKAIKQFWINLKAAMEDLVMNVIWPDIRKTMKAYPGNIDLELYSLGLGMVAPRIENIKVHTDSEGYLNDNLNVDIHLTFASEASIDFRLKTHVNPKVSMRLESLILSIKLRIGLVGVMPEIPMIKGFAVTLLETPEVDWKLGGIGKIADMSWMDQIIKDLITEQVLMFVIPNKITIPLNCLSLPPAILDNVDSSIFHRIIVPEPTGLVKVIIKKARNLPATDYSSSLMRPSLLCKSPLSFIKKIIPGKRSSDPYVKVSVGSSNFKSEVCFNTLDPEFDFGCEIPVEGSCGQELKISFWDYDSTSHNDWLGSRQELLAHLVKNSGRKLSQELDWYGIDGTVSGQCLMSSQWIPVRASREKIVSGVVAFSITGLRGDTVSLPDIKIRLVEDEDGGAKIEDGIDCQGSKEWKALSAFKESKEFKLGPVGSPECDIFMLRGGMLRFKAEHKDILIEVHDSLDRESEIGKRVWKHKVALTDVASRSKHGKSLTFGLEKGFDRKANIINKTKQQLGYCWKRVTGLTGSDGKEGLEVLEDEKMEIDLQFTFYCDQHV